MPSELAVHPRERQRIAPWRAAQRRERSIVLEGASGTGAVVPERSDPDPERDWESPRHVPATRRRVTNPISHAAHRHSDDADAPSRRCSSDVYGHRVALSPDRLARPTHSQTINLSVHRSRQPRQFVRRLAADEQSVATGSDQRDPDSVVSLGGTERASAFIVIAGQ